MSQKYILALDQGTTSSRAILFDHNAQIIQVAQKEFAQYYPQSGWVEHSPNEIFETQLKVAQDCLRRAQVEGGDVLAIGISNQRETTLVWDAETGAPVYNAIVWQDRRTAAFCDILRREGKGKLIRQKTGLVLDAYFSATKIRWILDHVPQARKKAEEGKLRFGTVDSWLVWNLSKHDAHVTDPSNASRTLLYNIHTGDWDEELLHMMDVPRSLLPQVVPSSSLMAHTHASFFGSALPIAGLAGDQQAATYGNGCLQAGMAKNTYGTGCFLLMNTGDTPCISENNLLTTVAWQKATSTKSSSVGSTPEPLQYALEGSVFVGGAVVQWLRDGLQIIEDASDMESLALSVPDNGGLLFVPAFVGLGAPYWDQYARGTLLGITRGTQRGHMARASLESIALQTADVIDAMQKDAGIPMTTLRVDGGASGNSLLMQYQSDITGLVVERPMITETTALGVAALAGLAVGFWDSEEELASKWQLERRFEPQISQDQRESLLYQWHRAVSRARAWIEE